MYSKMRAFPLFIRQPCLNSVWTSLHLCHSHWLCSLRFQTHILLWLCAKENWKDLSVCFHFCLIFTVWPPSCTGSKKKLNKKKDEISFTSVLSGKIPAWGYELYTGLTEVQRFQSGMYAHVVMFLYCTYCTVGDMKATCLQFLCHFLC